MLEFWRSSYNQSKFPWAQIVLHYWMTIFKFIWSTIYSKRKNEPLAVVFNSTFIYIDVVLSVNNSYFHYYINYIHVYPTELEIKGIKEKNALWLCYLYTRKKIKNKFEVFLIYIFHLYIVIIKKRVRSFW